MNTKECIKFLESIRIEGMYDLVRFNKIGEIIGLLQRGEKFEAMWGDIEHLFSAYAVSNLRHIKQKYFPKSVNKVITIEVEADNKDVLKGELNFIKAFFERNKDMLQCKYKVKEGD